MSDYCDTKTCLVYTALYPGFSEVCSAAEPLRYLLDGCQWRRPEFSQKHQVS